MSENEFKPIGAYEVMKVHALLNDPICQQLQKELEATTQLLSQERDEFRKKETQLMHRISALEMKAAEGTVLTFVCNCGERISASPLPMYEAKIKQLEATNKRYRAALEKISNMDYRGGKSSESMFAWNVLREKTLEGTGDE